MGYPVYKLIRAVNRQYPNNGFINYVDVREDMYNHDLIDEDLRDLLNETIQEIYKDVAIDEVYTFPTVAGQNQYVLPEDCDLRDIQEVVRRGIFRPHLPPPPHGEANPYKFYVTFDRNGGTGTMTAEYVDHGEEYILPECGFTPPVGKEFVGWQIGEEEYNVGDEVEIHADTTITALWESVGLKAVIAIYNTNGTGVLRYKELGDDTIPQEVTLNHGDAGFTTLGVEEGATLSTVYEYIEMYDYTNTFRVKDLSSEVVNTDNQVISVAVPTLGH